MYSFSDTTGVKVFVNGAPDLSLISESLMGCFIEAIIEQIIGSANKNNK